MYGFHASLAAIFSCAGIWTAAEVKKNNHVHNLGSFPFTNNRGVTYG